MKSWKVYVLALIALAALIAPAGRIAAAPPQPVAVEEGALSGNGNNKLPSVATGNGRVFVAWSVDNAARLAERDEESGQFATNTLGSVGANATYFNAAVAAGADGTVHYAWIQQGNTIHYRRRPAGQGWSGDQSIAGGLSFANGMSLAVQGSANVFVAWRLGDGGIGFAVSHDAGGSWPVHGNVPLRSTTYSGAPRLAASASGAVFLIWKAVDGGIYVGQWNGSNFASGRIVGGGNDYFNPTIAVAPNGQAYAAWRSIGSGVLVATRQGDGSWSVANVFRHNSVAGPVSVVADSLGDVHLAWLSQEGGAWRTWYAMKTPSDTFSSPIPVSHDNGYKADADMAVSVKSGYVLAHISWESFAGGQSIRYARARTSVSGTPAPVPVPPPPPPPPPSPNAPPTGRFDFATGAFRDLWTRTDSLVAGNAVTYSWLWGPQAFTQGVQEPYAQSPGKTRLVQYFDKSRMEINQPDAARGPWYVTNGRLADELITGLMQTGDAQYEQHTPAAVAVAGDPQNSFPLYRDLQAVYRKARAADHANELIYRANNGSLQKQPLPNANTDPAMLITQRVNGIGIPKVFWDFMNRSGRVVENGRVIDANPFFDWRFVVGEPLTEAYWTYIKVNGRDQGVLVQAFERRVLTFTPSNPGDFQVEMGNIGRHYFEWRYGVRPR